jgi:acyl carrier protein
MTINEFINEFSNIFEDTDILSLNPDTSYLDLDEWDSMIALATMAHFDEEFNIKIEPETLFKSNSFKDLYNSLFK